MKNYHINRLKKPYDDYLIALFLITITVWGYYDTLDDFFVMDDIDVIRGFSSAQGFLKHLQRGMGGDFYRPLAHLVFMWDFYWSDWQPFGYHVSNLFFHIINTLLVYWITQRLVNRSFSSITAGIFFSLHAIHAEAVSWISGRFDLICATFFLLSISAFIYSSEQSPSFLSKRRSIAYWLSVIFFACALLSKEMAVTLPLIIISYDLIFLRRSLRIGWNEVKRYAPYWLMLGGYFALRFFLFSGLGGYRTQLVGLFLIENLITYCKFLAIPFTDALYSSSWEINLAGIALISMVCLLASPATRFAITWIFITLLPVFALTIYRGAYLSSVGFCILGGIVLTAPLSNIACLIEKPMIQNAWRTLQFLVIAVIAFHYGAALLSSNAWWSGIADINENVPLMVKTIHPTFPKGAKICFKHLPTVINQRFNQAFLLRYPHSKFGGIYTELDECARQLQKLERMYFFHYDQHENIVYDVTYQQREIFMDSAPNVTKSINAQLSQARPQLHVEFDAAVPVNAIGIVSSLGNGQEIPQGQLIASIHIIGSSGEQEAFEIVAGQDTADWAMPALNKQDDTPRVYKRWIIRRAKHDLSVARNYMTKIELRRPLSIKTLSITLAPPANLPEHLMLDIERIALYSISDK